MGIPYYVASLLKTHRSIQTRYDTFECDVLGLDFNCFIHTVLDDADPIGSVVKGLRTYLDRIRAKTIVVAFDGLVPYAKMVQQRYRRFKKSDKGVFDRNQISPGTTYMLELEAALRTEFPHLIISGTREPGEGEHKLFTYLRGYEGPRRRIAIYGLDADLVLIALAQHRLGDIYLLRDDDAFSIAALIRALPMPVDDYVRKCILCFGNDFMPTLGMFSLRHHGHARAMHLTLEKAAEQETAVLVKSIPSEDGYALELRHGLRLDGILDWKPVVQAFWKTYMWTLHYFTTSEVPDWCWVYPYAEAPLVQTLVDFDEPMEFEWEYPDPPFGIAEQLDFILPKSGDYLYSEETETRPLWMKRFPWESDPLIHLPWDPARALTSVSEWGSKTLRR